MLIDQAKIYVEGGSGGDGCESLYKDIFNRRGVPDGGNGGDGGDVKFISDTNLQTLLDFRYNQHYKASDGSHGGSNNKQGRRGKDLIVLVPAGTIIKESATGLIIRDLKNAGESVVAARGGAGGRGNATRKETTPGAKGEVKTLLLELRLVAEAGLIGLPNAGKSTLISVISRAHSKIAPYPFTTKSPKLGMVQVEDDSFAVADMPGLVEGAHSGKGLGDLFLRHIERTLVLVHIVDIIPPDGSDPADNYKKLEKELELYSEDVARKPRIIAANKMDLAGAEEAYRNFCDKVGKKVYAISAVKAEGVKELVSAVYKKIKNIRDKHEKDNDKDRDESFNWLTE